MSRVAFLIAIISVAWCASPTSAADAGPPSIQKISLGFGGQYRPGYWCPIRIEVIGGSQEFRGRLEIVAPDGDGVATRFVQTGDSEITIPSGERQTIRRLIKPGRSGGQITVELQGTDGNQRRPVARAVHSASELARPIPAERRLIATFGSPISVEDAVGQRSRFSSMIAVCDLSQAEEFPEHWLGLESIDTLLLLTSDLNAINGLATSQIQAIHDWVINGGRLIWSAGRNGKELIGETGKFAQLSPGRFVEVASLRSLSSIETFSGAVQPLDLGSNAGIPISVLDRTAGRIELAESGSTARPLLIRTPHGFGQIVFTAFDLDTPPIADWEGRNRILSRILQGPSSQSDRRNQPENSDVERFGYRDMVGQLRSGMDQFPEVTFVPFSWVAGLVLLYIVIIVPLDYFLLRDLLRRMTLTWITFPLITVLFVAATVWLGGRWKGNENLLNQLDLVDVDVLTKQVRGTSWAHLYSPNAAKHDLGTTLSGDIQQFVSPEGNTLAWQGLPGTGLGGLNTGAAAPPAINEYRVELTHQTDSNASASLQTQMDGVPIHVASTKSLLGRWWGKAELQGDSKLSFDADGLLRGQLTNPLPIELQDCVVFFENWAFRLDSRRGVLQPGESARIEDEKALNLQWRLTGRRVIQTKDRSTPWDQHTLVVPQIVEMMMFHATAGGETYTQLANQYQSYVDLSSHLTTGRAVLIGKSQEPAVNLMLDGAPRPANRQWTYYRVVFPVSRPEPK